jgi:acyl dehydratase
MRETDDQVQPRIARRPGQPDCGMTTPSPNRQATSLRFGPRKIEKADILAFAAAFDPQPAHLDEAAALETPLRGLAASGWHTCAVVAHAVEDALGRIPGYAGMTGLDELRWLRPVRPEDELLGEVVLGPATACTCGGFDRRPALIEARNAWGRTVVRWSCQVLLDRCRTGMPAFRCDLGAARPPKAKGRPGEHFIKYFEDVRCGDEIALGSYLFSPESVGIFERMAEPRGTAAGRAGAGHDPMHVPGWNVVAGWMSLIVAYYERRAAQLAGAGLPVPKLGPATGLRWLRWLRPVSLGERISFRGWVEHKVNAAGAGQWGLLVAGAEGHNEAGEPVVSFYPQFLLERRATCRALERA